MEKTAAVSVYKNRQGSRPSIGFILRDNMTANFDVPMWASMVKSAQALDVNLVTYLTHPMWYSQEGLALNLGIYRQINPGVIDGLLSVDMGIPLVAEKLSHYAGFPNVVLVHPQEGYPSIVFSQDGMRMAVDHLVEVHRKKRILYIGGNKGNPEAEARLAAYRASLQSHQIDFDPALVFAADFDNPAVAEAIIDQAIDPGQLNFDALVCANDLMAAAAIGALQKHHLSVPYDIAVTGFDDDARASSSLPPLTTVRASFGAITSLGAQRLLQVINLEPVPIGVETYPTELVVRQSCGCLPQSVLAASSRAFRPPKGIVLNIDFVRMNQVMAETLGRASVQLPENWQKNLWDAFLHSLKSSRPKAFIRQLDNLERLTLEQGASLEQWQGVLSVMRSYAVYALSNQVANLGQHVEDLFNQGRIFTAEMTQHSSIRSGLENEDKNTRLLETIQSLLKTFSMQGLLDELSGAVSEKLAIPAVYLALYDDPRWPPQNARLVMGCTREQGRLDTGRDGIVFPASRLLPDPFMPSGRRFHLVTAPLYFQDENLGYIVFEAGPIDNQYAILQKLVSSALKGALLSRQNDDLLNNCSEISRTPGVVSPGQA